MPSYTEGTHDKLSVKSLGFAKQFSLKDYLLAFFLQDIFFFRSFTFTVNNCNVEKASIYSKMWRLS